MLNSIFRTSAKFIRLRDPAVNSVSYVCGNHGRTPPFSPFKAQVLHYSEESQPLPNTNESSTFNLASAVKDNPELEHKLKVLTLEVDVMRQDGYLIPSSIKDFHWEELLKLPSYSSRKRYLEFLFKTEKKKENAARKREIRRTEWEEKKPELLERKDLPLEEFAHTYSLSANNLFLRFYDSTMNQMYNNRLVQAMQFGQKLVIDCGYDQNMTKRENTNCAKQLMLVFAENRFHDDPFDLHFCNADPQSDLIRSLGRHIPTMYEPSFPINIHDKSYRELFPTENLVYLTPHCREEMLEFDHDAIYIIGGIVDKVNNEPLSLAKAKREGLKMAKFPLDRYLLWGTGSGKSLALNQVTSILLDLRKSGDWKYALRHVPKRKISEYTNNQSSPSQFSGTFNTRSRQNSDGAGKKRNWSPVNFNELSFNTNSSKERLLKVRTIMNDDE